MTRSFTLFRMTLSVKSLVSGLFDAKKLESQ